MAPALLGWGRRWSRHMGLGVLSVFKLLTCSAQVALGILFNAMAAKKLRKANFSSAEDVALLEGYHDNKYELQSKFQSTVSKTTKKAAWATVTSAVNAVSTVSRTAEEVKERWGKLAKKARAQLRARKYPRTGGGGKQEEMANIDLMADIFEDSALIEGVAASIDSGHTNQESECGKTSPVTAECGRVLEVVADETGILCLPPASCPASSQSSCSINHSSAGSDEIQGMGKTDHLPVPSTSFSTPTNVDIRYSKRRWLVCETFSTRRHQSDNQSETEELYKEYLRKSIILRDKQIEKIQIEIDTLKKLQQAP